MEGMGKTWQDNLSTFEFGAPEPSPSKIESQLDKRLKPLPQANTHHMGLFGLQFRRQIAPMAWLPSAIFQTETQ